VVLVWDFLFLEFHLYKDKEGFAEGQSLRNIA
jgi:hypothetical protein